MKKIVLALIALSSLTLQSCDDADVALGVGFVGGVIVGSSHSSSCRGGYYTTCSTYRNRWGERVRECREVYDYCRYSWNSQAANQSGSFSDMAQNVSDFSNAEGLATKPVATVANKYQIGFEASEKIVSALKQGQTGNLDALKEMGLSKKDMIRLYEGKNLSEKTVEQLGTNLNLSTETVNGFVTHVLEDVRAARAAQEN